MAINLVASPLTDYPNEEWDFILYLRNTQNQGFINQNQISKEEHYEFMKQHYKDYYIVGFADDYDSRDGGVVWIKYIGFIGVVNNDIRFAIDPEYQGKGYGTILLSFIKEKYPIAIGKVKHDNIASQKAFIKAGYSCYKQDDQFCYYTI